MHAQLLAILVVCGHMCLRCTAVHCTALPWWPDRQDIEKMFTLKHTARFAHEVVISIDRASVDSTYNKLMDMMVRTPKVIVSHITFHMDDAPGMTDMVGKRRTLMEDIVDSCKEETNAFTSLAPKPLSACPSCYNKDGALCYPMCAPWQRRCAVVIHCMA